VFQRTVSPVTGGTSGILPKVPENCWKKLVISYNLKVVCTGQTRSLHALRQQRRARWVRSTLRPGELANEEHLDEPILWVGSFAFICIAVPGGDHHG
jgi:hypothetical protein